MGGGGGAGRWRGVGWVGGGGGLGGWWVGVGGCQLRFVTRSSIIIQCCCDSVSSGYQIATNIHIYHNSAHAKLYTYIERKHSFGIGRKSSIRFHECLICDHVLKTQACQVRLNIYRLYIPRIVQTILSCFAIVRYSQILATFFRMLPLVLSGEYSEFTIKAELDHDTATNNAGVFCMTPH